MCRTLASSRRARSTARGTVLIYVGVMMVVVIGVAMLVVDYGRLQVARNELQGTADAAARYAASAMRSSSTTGTSAAAANASAVFAQNTIDGGTISFDPTVGVTLGIWTPVTRTFLPATIAAGANAVKIDASLMIGSGGRALTVASLLNRTSSVRASSIAMVNDRSTSTYVSAQGNPWLAGMPAGTVSKSYRTSPAEWDYAGAGPNVAGSPGMINVSTLGISAGTSIVFDGVTGASSWSGGNADGDADGDATRVVTLGSPEFNDFTYFNSSMNGMSNIKAPINSMMAVFLSDDVPTNTATPSPLDFGTAASREFTTLAPALKQVFFVGNGRRSTGEAQRFVVPPGATRVFIGSMDGWQWNNNTGGYTATIHAAQKITIVK